jgi:ArsR family transcriptional regulator
MIKEVEKYKAIGEETRLRILRILIKAKAELCVCEIIDVLKKPQYNISKNLSILKRVELVEERRDGRLMMYKIKVGNLFNKKLFESISLIKGDSNPVFKDDFDNLEKRLSLRENGKCIITYKP